MPMGMWRHLIHTFLDILKTLLLAFIEKSLTFVCSMLH